MAKPVDTQEHLMRDAFYGILIGSACGDACGFFFEGMTADQVSCSGKDILRFHILGPTGFISDDTELLAITARALITSANNDDLFHEHFKKALLAWFFTLPFGIGRGTYQACLKIMCGARHTGSRSAGNGPALRAAIIGAYFLTIAIKCSAWCRPMRALHTLIPVQSRPQCMLPLSLRTPPMLVC